MNRMFSTLLICLCLFGGMTSTVSANGTSYFEDSSYPTGHVLPMEEGMVRIVSEDLSIRLEKVSNWLPFSSENPTIKAHIHVIYEMENQQDKEVEVPIAFPQPGDTDQWHVTLNDSSIPVEGTVSIPREQLIGEHPHYEWINPRTREGYQFGGYDVYSEFNHIDSQTFTIVLEPENIHTLQIEYVTLLGMDERQGLHPIYRLDYLLHPASYWSDFNNLTLKIDVPFGAEMTTNLPLSHVSGNEWLGEFESLPEENLVLFLSPHSGLLIDLFHSRGLAMLFLLVLLLAFYPIGRLLMRIISVEKRKPVSLLFLFMFIWAGYDILDHKIMGYPLTIFHLGFFIIYFFSLLFLWRLMIRGTTVKRYERQQL